MTSKTTRAEAARKTASPPQPHPEPEPAQALALRYLRDLALPTRSAGDVQEEADAPREDLFEMALAPSTLLRSYSEINAAQPRPSFPVETGLAAAQIARAVAAVPGLAENLSKAKPMALIVHVADSEACDAAKRAFRHAILPAKTEFTCSDESTPARPTAITHVDDGTETGRLWRKSAARDLHHGLRRGQCVICITTDPGSFPTPSARMRRRRCACRRRTHGR